jgi:hypothetical protein
MVCLARAEGGLDDSLENRAALVIGFFLMRSLLLGLFFAQKERS